MGDRTGIEWADATWNPVTGCTKVSEGCENCYAETIANRFAGTPAYPNAFRVTLRPERLGLPLRWQRPRRVFVNSMSDLFHADVPGAYIAQVFAVMALASRHTFQVLTKRPGRMKSLLASRDFRIAVHDEIEGRTARQHSEVWPLPNVWLGTSVETQKWADVRIQQLIETPASVRFLSCEPLLGPVRLCSCDGADYQVQRHPFLVNPACPLHGQNRIGWVIVGGESGSQARPMHPNWARLLRDQCNLVGVPFLFKQWGEWRRAREADDPAYEMAHGDQFPQPWLTLESDGRLHTGAPGDGAATVQRVGKKAVGRVLDGRVWDQYPEVG